MASGSELGLAAVGALTWSRGKRCGYVTGLGGLGGGSIRPDGVAVEIGVIGVGAVGIGGHPVVETVGVVGVIGVIGVIGVAGRAFTRICGSGPATDAGQTSKVGTDADASPGARAGTAALAAFEALDTSQDILEAGVTSVLLLGDADWCTGDLGGVGPAVFLDALAHADGVVIFHLMCRVVGLVVKQLV